MRQRSAWMAAIGVATCICMCWAFTASPAGPPDASPTKPTFSSAHNPAAQASQQPVMALRVEKTKKSATEEPSTGPTLSHSRLRGVAPTVRPQTEGEGDSRAGCGSERITQLDEPLLIEVGSMAACQVGGIVTENNYARCFELDEDFTLECVEIGIETQTNPGNVDYVCDVVISVDTNGCPPTAPNGADLLELDRRPIVIPANTILEVLTVEGYGNLPLPAGPIVLEIQCPDGGPDSVSFWPGGNFSPESACMYLAAADCGLPYYSCIGDISFMDPHLVGNLLGDFGPPPVCGDGMCTGGETCDTCPQDCGGPCFCGNGTCDPGEDCDSCPGDCGECPIGSGNCCEDHCGEGPGCEDPVCEASVCSYDPFCCDVCWDGICAGEAAGDPNCICP